MAKLPSISSSLAPDLRRFLDRVRDAFNGSNPIVTRSDLLGSGSHTADSSGNLTPTTPTAGCIPPPSPTNLAASGAMTSIFLTWDGINGYGDNCHNYTEIFRASTDNFSNAVLIGVSRTGRYTDAVGADSTYYYWIRFINVNNQTGPMNQTAGTSGSTAPDVDYLLDQLTGAISESELISALQSRIDLIDTDTTGLVDRMIAEESTSDTLQAQINDLNGTPDFDSGDSYDVNDLVKYSGSIYRCILSNPATSTAPPNATYWELVGEYDSIADIVAAHTVDITALETLVDGEDVGALATTVSGLSTTVSGHTTDISANSGDITTLEVQVGATDVVALASSHSTLSTTVGGHTTTIGTHATSISGLEGQYTVKVDIDGYVSGFGLASTAKDAAPFSEFAIVADKFTIAGTATDHEADDGSPFFHLTTSETINGATVPAGTYIKSANIHNAAITNAKIGALAVETGNIADLAVGDAQIDNINADKIDAGTLTARTVQTAASGKRIVLNSTTNEAEFYGDRGDTVVEKLATIGIDSNVEGDTVVGNFGSANCDYVALSGVSDTEIGVYGRSYNDVGVFGYGLAYYGVYGTTNLNATSSAITAESSAAIFGVATNATGVHGKSTNRIGVLGHLSTGQNGANPAAGVYGYCASSAYRHNPAVKAQHARSQGCPLQIEPDAVANAVPSTSYIPGGGFWMPNNQSNLYCNINSALRSMVHSGNFSTYFDAEYNPPVGLEQIAAYNFTGQSYVDLAWLSDAYTNLVLVYEGFHSTTRSFIYARIISEAGYVITNSHYSQMLNLNANTLTDGAVTTQTSGYIQLSHGSCGNDNYEGMSGRIEFTGMESLYCVPGWKAHGTWMDDSQNGYSFENQGIFRHKQVSDRTRYRGIRIGISSGTLSANSKVRIYGAVLT